LPDESVSEEHAFIDWDGQQVTITDLGSKNGTFVAGIRLPPQERYSWQGGAPVRIGVYWLRLIPPLVQAASVVAPAVYGVPGPEAVAAPPRAAGAPPPRAPSPVTPGFGAPAIPPTAAASPQAGITQMPAPGTPQSVPLPPQAPLQPPGGTPAGEVGVTQPPLSSNRYAVELEQDVTTLIPGMPAVLRMTLHNYSDSVDHLRVDVQGVPETWIQGPTLNRNCCRTVAHRWRSTLMCRARQRAAPVLIWSPSMPAHGAAPMKLAPLRRPGTFRRSPSIGWN